jgi:hypothetical protein
MYAAACGFSRAIASSAITPVKPIELLCRRARRFGGIAVEW